MFCGNCYFEFTIELGLWCLMVLSTIFQRHHGVQFYWWRTSEYPEKTIALPEVTDKRCHIILYRVHFVMSGKHEFLET